MDSEYLARLRARIEQSRRIVEDARRVAEESRGLSENAKADLQQFYEQIALIQQRLINRSACANCQERPAAQD